MINPESDTQFVGEVEAAMASGLSETHELQRLLRFDHPQATVRNRVRGPDGRARWYVYREGAGALKARGQSTMTGSS